MKEPGDRTQRRARQRSVFTKKSQALVVSLGKVLRVAKRWSLAPLMVLAILTTFQTPAWSAGVSDIIWLESNSTAGNSILAFKNTGTASPTFLGSTPAGGIGVFDSTFGLGPNWKASRL